MAFDFMKNFMMFEDEERFAKLCEVIEDAIREADNQEEKMTDVEIMQALDFVGFNFFRDDWEEYKKMEVSREFNLIPPAKDKGKRLIN